jgi:hypothetical protein
MEPAVTHPRASEHLFVRLASIARFECALLLFGIGVIAIHVLDDSFLQPKPGAAGREDDADWLWSAKTVFTPQDHPYFAGRS